jgi:hypothetical protein
VDLTVHEKKVDGDDELAAADEQGARAEDVGVDRVAELGWEAEQRRRRLLVGLAVEVHFALVMVAVRGSVWKDSTDKMCAGVGPAVLATRHVTLLAHGLSLGTTCGGMAVDYHTALRSRIGSSSSRPCLLST